MYPDGDGEHVHSLPGGPILVRVSPPASSRLPEREARLGKRMLD
jgi:hypothetical protein